MSFHEKLVEQIQRKMAGDSNIRTQQQKKQMIFQYDNYQSEFNNLQGYHPPKICSKNLLISANEVEQNLSQIYHFYINSYIQPRKHYQTFDDVNKRKLTFQPYILFMKQFKLLKIIFPLQKIKVLFNKYSNFGRFLTIQNFIFLINQLSHQQQARDYFSIPNNVDLQTQDQLQKQQLYNYMNLHNPKKYRKNLKQVFQPFLCKQKPQFNRKNFSYRKFSLPELRKKAIPPKRGQQDEQPDLYVVKNQQNYYGSQFDRAKSIIVSWDTLKDVPRNGIQQNSAQVVHKKYVKNDPQDDIFLGQYKMKQNGLRKSIQNKLKQMQSEQSRKNKLFLSKLSQKQQTMKLKSSQSRKSLQKIPNWK